MRRSLGLDDPVPVQFGRYLARAAQGDFGVSYQFRQPVSTLLAERMPATLELAFCATLFAIVVRHPDGRLLGPEARDSFLAKLFQTISLVGISLPTFLIGILLIYLFAVTLAGCHPSDAATRRAHSAGGRPGFSTSRVCKAIILPSMTLGLFQMTLIMRLVRAEMLEVLRTDYIKFARARGLSRRGPINFGHALKNTLVPVITIVGLQLGSRDRLRDHHRDRVPVARHGAAVRRRVQNVDIPIMAAYLMLVALIFVMINLVVDILYTVVDPRLRSSIRQPA